MYKKCIFSITTTQSKYREFHHHRKFSSAPLQSIPTPTYNLRQPLICFLNVLVVLELLMNQIIQNVVFCLASFAQYNVFNFIEWHCAIHSFFLLIVHCGLDRLYRFQCWALSIVVQVICEFKVLFYTQGCNV